LRNIVLLPNQLKLQGQQ